MTQTMPGDEQDLIKRVLMHVAYPGLYEGRPDDAELRVLAREALLQLESHPQPSPDAEDGPYSEGIMSDGACILYDGVPVPVGEVVARLNAAWLKSQPSGREMSKCNNCGCVLPVRYDKCGLCSQGEALLKENAELRKALSAAPGKE